MAAPTFVASGQTAWGSASSTAKSSSTGFNLATGDVLVGLGGAEGGGSSGTPSYTFTPAGFIRQTVSWYSAQQANNATTQSAVDATDTGSGVIPTILYNVTGNYFGGAFAQFSGSGGLGAAVQNNSGVSDLGASASITTQQDNSAIVAIFVDWNAADGASRVYSTLNGVTPTAGSAYELAYFRDSLRYTVYAVYWPDAGAAGAKTIGLSTPATMRFAVSVVEILGTAGPPPTPGEGSYNDDATDQMWMYTGLGYNDGSLM